MNQMTKSIIIIGLSILFLGNKAYSFEKVGTTSFQFLKVMTNARHSAMAEASSAVVNTSASVFFNPAGLTTVKKLDFTADYLDWFLDISHLAFAAAYTIPQLGTFAFQGMLTDVGEIRVTTVESLGFVGDQYLGYTGETITPGSQVFGLSFARMLTDKFSFGITAKYAREDLGARSADNFMFDGGLTYNTGFRSIKIAAVVRHFGPDVKFYDEVDLPRTDPSTDSTFFQKYTGKSYPLPQTFNIGVSAYLLAPSQSLFIESDGQTLLVAFDLVQPRDFDQQYNLGLEYGFRDILFLRAGYKFNYDEESFSLGFGLAYNKYRIDYAYSDFGDLLDSVHRFSLGFGFK